MNFWRDSVFKDLIAIYIKSQSPIDFEILPFNNRWLKSYYIEDSKLTDPDILLSLYDTDDEEEVVRNVQNF